MSTPARLTLCGVLAVAITLDLDATRRATVSAPLSSAFAVDAPAPDLILACEGRIAGTWMITNVSAESFALAAPTCPGHRIDALAGSGTLVLNQDGTFADTTILTVASTSFIPTSSGAPTCALVEAQMASREGIRSVSCTDDLAGACACAVKMNPLSRRYRFTGKYKVVSALQSNEPRCVTPNVMKLRRTFEGNTYVLTVTKVET